MPGFASTLLIITVVLIAAVVVVVWLGLRLVGRAVTKGRSRALELRTHFLPPGPRRDAAALRQRLAGELRSTRQTLAAVPNARIFLADPSRLLAEAAEYAVALDHELAMIGRSPTAGNSRPRSRRSSRRCTPCSTRSIPRGTPCCAPRRRTGNAA